MESSLLNYNFTVLILFPSGCFSTHFIFLLIFYSLACHHPQSRWFIQDLGEDQGSTKVPFFSREKSTHISNWMAKELWIQWCMLCYSHRPLWNTDLHCVWYYDWEWCSFLYRRVFFVLSRLYVDSYTDSVKLISEDYLSGNVDALKIVKNMISTDLIVLAGEILLDVYVIALMSSE